MRICSLSADPTLYSLILGHRSYELRVEPFEGSYRVQLDGVTYDVEVEDERDASACRREIIFGFGSPGKWLSSPPCPALSSTLRSMPGDAVEAGQTLVVVESMKMHNEFTAPRAGTIRAVRVEVGAKVAQNTILVTLA